MIAETSTMDRTRIHRISLLLIAAALFPIACTLRIGHVEHYVGPVLFRYSQPPDGMAYVSQVLRFGLSAETGTQMGVSVGLSDRIAASPRVFSPADSDVPVGSVRWSTPLSLLSTPVPEHWNLSLLYLRVEGVPELRFVSRSIYGVEVLLGKEASAVSVGVVSRTYLEPPEDAFSVMRFDASRPMETLFWTWHPVSEQDLSLSSVLKEVEP